MGCFSKSGVERLLTDATLLPSDLAWAAGFVDWIPLSDLIAEPSVLLSNTSPASSITFEQEALPANAHALSQNFDGRKAPSQNSFGDIKIIFVSLVLAISFGFFSAVIEDSSEALHQVFAGAAALCGLISVVVFFDQFGKSKHLENLAEQQAIAERRMIWNEQNPNTCPFCLSKEFKIYTPPRPRVYTRLSGRGIIFAAGAALLTEAICAPRIRCLGCGALRSIE